VSARYRSLETGRTTAMAIETTCCDPAKRLTTPEAQAAYLEATLEDGDPAIIAAALEDIARAVREREDRERGSIGRG